MNLQIFKRQIVIGVGVVFFSLSIDNSLIYANYQFTPDEAIRAIIGEASGEPFEGQVAIGEAIRKRGTLKGVYGVKAPHVDRQGKEVWEKARRAWEVSQSSKLTDGASGWGNSEDLKQFRKTRWWKRCEVTKKIGNHYFYKELNRKVRG